MSRREDQHQMLERLARQAMVERGLEPDFPPAVFAEIKRLDGGPPANGKLRDLTALPWCSIDNDDSKDLDQLTVAETLTGGTARLMVAVADVTGRVTRGSAIDDHASTNTTSVYTPPRVFPMLPERLSTDLTSLNPDEDRDAIVVAVEVQADGATGASEVFAARVRNQAQLAYSGVGPWLEGQGEQPGRIGSVHGLAENLKLQDSLAQRLRERRHEQGALELETIEVHARFDGGAVSRLEAERRNRAKELIEDFMISANGAVARFLEQKSLPVIRRVVRTPQRWARIVAIAQALGDDLPATPDAKALHEFLLRRRAADPLRFPDLSLAVIKLLGNGQYEARFPGDDVTGHFGLAVHEYTHSTAPNRRYPDLLTQRLVKAALAGEPSPYSRDQLVALAAHCTNKEDDAQKVERQMRKAAAACLLASRIGDTFRGIVTGAGAKGAWVRVFDPPVEGRVVRGEHGLDVGDTVKVRLLHTDPEKGFIDFERLGPAVAGPRG